MLSKSQKTFAWWFLTSGGSPGMARGRNKIPSTLLDALAAACKKVFAEIVKQREAAKRPKGRQSVKKLMNHRTGTEAAEYVGAPRQFDRVARKFNVDYAFYKVAPEKYLLFFKSGQSDAITACLSEYSKRVMNKSRRPSIRQQLRHFGEKARVENKARELKREVGHVDR